MDDGQIDISNDEPEVNSDSKKTKKSHRGLWVSLFVLIVVAAVAAGGWKWYGQISEYQMKQNDADKKISQLQKTVDDLTGKDSSGSTELTESISVDGGDNTFTIKYPLKWVALKTTHKTELSAVNTTVEDATITAPSKELTVSVQTGISGLGGACIASENPSWKLDTFTLTAIPSSSGYSLMEYNSVNAGRYGSAVVQNTTVKSVKQGSHICDIAFADYMNLNLPQGAVHITISSKALQAKIDANKTLSQAEIKDFFASSEYKVARSILLSLIIK